MDLMSSYVWAQSPFDGCDMQQKPVLLLNYLNWIKKYRITWRIVTPALPPVELSPQEIPPVELSPQEFPPEELSPHSILQVFDNFFLSPHFDNSSGDPN